jgi:hypothetical protein
MIGMGREAMTASDAVLKDDRIVSARPSSMQYPAEGQTKYWAGDLNILVFETTGMDATYTHAKIVVKR